MRSLLAGLKVLLCAVLVNAMVQPGLFRLPAEFRSVAQADVAPPPGADLPGFGGATAPPRMLIIMDTSKSMAATPDMSRVLPFSDYDGQPDSTMSPSICGEDPDSTLFPNSSGLSTAAGMPNQNTGAMQGTNLNLSCPAGQTIVQIDWAAYGKRTNTVSGTAQSAAVANFDPTKTPCSMTSVYELLDNTALDGAGVCTAALSTQQTRPTLGAAYRGWVDIQPTVESLCVGKETCSFLVDNTLGGDPCSGTGFGKYALVSFRCSTDPCPPSSSSNSKFCIAKKALHRLVSDNASDTFEMAGAGYFQTKWTQYHPAVNASYVSNCTYDTLAKSSTTYRQNELTLTSDDEFGTAGVPALAGATSTYACNPETYVTATGPSAYPTQCDTQPSSHVCSKSYAMVNVVDPLYQHQDPAYRNVMPTGGPGTWSWGAGGTPPDRAGPIKKYFSNTASEWDPREGMSVKASDVGGSCVGAPATISNVPLTPAPLSASYPASCTATNPCTFFSTGVSTMTAIDGVTRFYNLGAAPQTIGGLQRDYVSVTTEGPVNILASEFGGTCPSAPPYTGTQGFTPVPCGPGDGHCDLTRVGSATPIASYSCAPGLTLVGTTCVETRTAYNSNLTVPDFVHDPSTDTWESSVLGVPFEYHLQLGQVSRGLDACFDGTTQSWEVDRFPLSTPALLSHVTGLGCGSSDTAFPGRCTLRGVSPTVMYGGAPILGEVNTDANTVTCKMIRYVTQYKKTTPAASNPYCTYTRTNYSWYNLDSRCEYRRFIYNYAKRSFTYTWQYNDGDYAGSFSRSLAYSPTATESDQYCSSSRPVQPLNPSYTDLTGFTVPSGDSCPAELAPGVGGCPADALRCKLRWNSPTNRFKYFKAPANFPNPNVSAAQPLVGCAVGDKEAQSSGDSYNLADYSTLWGDWCWTDPTKQPARAAYTDPPRLIADVYNLSVAGNNFSANYWTDGSGAIVHPNASGADTFDPALHARKDRGLSVSTIYPPTPALSFSDFGEPKSELLRLFKSNIGGGGTRALQLPELGNITPLTGALSNALEFLNQTKLADPSKDCRKYSILLVTDGNEDPAVPGGLASIATAALAANIAIYVVGFGIQSDALDLFARSMGTAVDDLGNSDNVSGHAYNASDFASLTNTLNLVIGKQLEGFYARSKPTLTSDARRLYSGYFSHGGTGDKEYDGYLDAYAIRSGVLSTRPDWQFDQKLDAQTSAPSSSHPRKVITRLPDTVTLSDFDVASACSGDSLKLVDGMIPGGCSTTMAAANEIIKYVRNDRPSPDHGTFDNGDIKVRRLSDIYHSQPAVLYAPFFSAAFTAPTPYAQLGGKGAGFEPTTPTSDFDSGKFTAAYTAFKAANVSRETTVFVGSNAGMVHAVRDHVTTATSWRGRERWAYVPQQLLTSLGGNRSAHTWLVDGSFALGEVCFGRDECERSNGRGWLSMLIGTAGRGGPFMFALDVTNPVTPEWLWDFNNNDASNPFDFDMGQTWSAPVLARVRVDNDYYKWGVFMGAGFKEAPGEANKFYVIDADPATRAHNAVAPMVDSAAVSAKFTVAGDNQVYAPYPTLATVPNNVPARARVVRPNDSSRASRVYFGDTNGVLWSMNVTSPQIANWAPTKLFNPFKMDVVNAAASDLAACRAAPIKPLPDRSPVPGDIVMTGGSEGDPYSLPIPNATLPGLYNRPYLGLDDNSAATMVYIGSGDATNPLDMNTTNYFWAVEDVKSLETGSTTECIGKLRWAYYLDNLKGEKVLGDPVIVGKNIIVAVYTPPSSSASICGAAGTSRLYCFDRLNGVPQNCLVDVSATPIDTTAASFGGRARFVEVGAPGIMSDLQAVGKTVVGTASGSPKNPVVIEVSDTTAPFRVRSWRRVR